MKKALSLILALIFVLTCASAMAEDEKFSITWMPAGGSGGYMLLDSKIEQWLEERYNVDLTVYQVQANNGEQANLLLATNDIPDCCFFYKSVNDMYKTGLIRSIPESMIREYMPDYAAFLDANPYGWTINKYPDGNGGFVPGEYGALSGYNGANTGYHWSPMFRYDWLQQLGIEAPGEVEDLGGGLYWCKEGYTMDQFTEIVKAFRDDDPDANGERDTYGLSGSGDTAYFNYDLYMFAGAMGLLNVDNFKEDGIVKPFYVTNAWKNVLAYLSDLAQNDYLDPEYVSQDYSQYWEKFTAGNCGIMLCNRTYLETRFNDRPPYSVLARDPEAKILITGVTVDDEGNGSTPAYNDIPFSYTTFISAKVDDDKLAKILEMLNDITSDPETFVTVTYGFPGETFDWEGEAWDSAVMSRSMDTETKGTYGIEAYSIFCRRPEFAKFMNNANITKLWDYATTAEGMSHTTLMAEYIDYSSQFKAERENWNEYYSAEATAIRDKFWASALTGGDIEGNWDAYLAELEEKGHISELMDIMAGYDSAYEVYALNGHRLGE